MNTMMLFDVHHPYLARIVLGSACFMFVFVTTPVLYRSSLLPRPPTYRPVARGGGRGGRTTPPPQLPIPKILFHPLAILFHPLAILFHLSAILFHPLAILFHPSAILFHPLAILFHPSAILFHPLAILFHPWNMWMTSHGQCPRGGGACECPRVGAFFKLMTSRGQCPRGGGCAWCSTHPSSDPPPPPGWLATGLHILHDDREIYMQRSWGCS